MGLDLYVGSLTRYFVGDWELMAQKVARELGMACVKSFGSMILRTRSGIPSKSAPLC